MSPTVPDNKQSSKVAHKTDPEEEQEIRHLLAELQDLEIEDDQITHDLNNARLNLTRKICDKYEEIRKLIVDEYCDSPLEIPATEPIQKEEYFENIERVVDEKTELVKEIELTKKKLLKLRHQNELADKTLTALKNINRFQFEKEPVDGEY